MRLLITITALLFLSSPSYADFKNGMIIPDFTIEDINGISWNLYDLLDEGKVVYIHLFGPAAGLPWEYHTSGTLQDFYLQHGASGDNSIEVLAVASFGSDIGWLNGLEEQAGGNWLANSPYPSFLDEPNSTIKFILDTWSVGDFYICPDRRVYRMWTYPSMQDLEIGLSSCPLATEANDASIVWSDVHNRANCPSETRLMNVYLSNNGSEPLTSADIEVTWANQVVQTYQWTGNLLPYHLDTVELNDLLTDGSTAIAAITVKNPNGLPDQDATNDTMSWQIAAATQWQSSSIRVDIQCDGYGHQIFWELSDGQGVTIDSGGNVKVEVLNGNGAPNDMATEYEDGQHIVKEIPVNTNDCITFKLLSGYGYGVCCDFGLGYVKLWDGNELKHTFTTFWKTFAVISTDGVVEAASLPTLSTFRVYPNPTDGQITLAFGLQAATDAGISVYNVMGQQVLQVPQTAYTSGNHETAIDVASLPNGMYWAVLQSNQGSQAVKFVVAK